MTNRVLILFLVVCILGLTIYACNCSTYQQYERYKDRTKCEVMKPIPQNSPGADDYDDQKYVNAWETYYRCLAGPMGGKGERLGQPVQRNDHGRPKTACATDGIGAMFPCFNPAELEWETERYKNWKDNGWLSFPNGQSESEYWYNSWKFTTPQEWKNAFRTLGIHK